MTPIARRIDQLDRMWDRSKSAKQDKRILRQILKVQQRLARKAKRRFR